MPIQITARRDGFRRCGMAHSDKTQTYPDGHFTPAQLQELERESQLIVVRIDNSQPAVISSGLKFEDVVAEHLKLQGEHLNLLGELRHKTAVIDALSDRLAIELDFGTSLQQELEALKVPPVPAPDDQADKQTGDPAGDDKATNSQAKTKK